MEEKPRGIWTEIYPLFQLSLEKNINLNPNLELRLSPYDEISNFTHRRTHCNLDTKWMTTNKPLFTTFTVSKLVCVVEVTEKRGGGVRKRTREGAGLEFSPI